MMRNFVLGAVLAIALIGCTGEEKVTFVNQDMVKENCNECPEILIDIPQAQPKTKAEAQKINETINNFVIAVLNFSEEHEADSIPQAIGIFNEEYKNLKNRFPESIIPWEATIKGDISYTNSKFASVAITSYVFTGGAHGYGSTSFLNFDTKTGKELTVETLFKDTDALADFVEKSFREQNNIEPEANINSTGFMFEDDAFHLPNSIGFDEKGMLLIYNPYEIAAYADGPAEIHIPFNEIKPFIKPEWLDEAP